MGPLTGVGKAAQGGERPMTDKGATTGESVLTIEKIQAAVDLMKNLPPEPIREWMLSNGFDPDKGDVVFWPSGDDDVFGSSGPPWYVTLSSLVTYPVVANVDILRKPLRLPAQHQPGRD